MAELTKEQLATLKALMPIITEYNSTKNYVLAGLKFVAVISKADTYKDALGLHMSPTTGDIQGNDLKPAKVKQKTSIKQKAEKKKTEPKVEPKSEPKSSDKIKERVAAMSDENELKNLKQKIIDELTSKETPKE